MIKHFAGRLLLPVSIALAVASCQQPSATTTSAPSVSASVSPTATASPSEAASPVASASPSESPSPEASESPKTDDTTASASDKTKAIEAVVKENAEYKEMYDATKGIEYIGLVEAETCKALDSGVSLDTLVTTLEKEFDKQSNTMPAEQLTKLKEYTGFVLGASVMISCPQHKDKIKS